MTNIEKVEEKVGKNTSMFYVMNNYCPSDYGLKDHCEGCVVTDLECIRCWTSEVKA